MIADIPTIVAHGLGVRRGGRWILRPATFSIASGVIGLAGQRRSGKTTLLSTLATLRRPAAGSLDLLGRPTNGTASPRAVRGRLGFLPDRFEWAAGLTVGEYVSYAAYFKDAPKEAVNASLERFELADMAMLEIGMLPADLRLRAGLAATCVHEPELVLADEPLTGLDARERDEMVLAVRALAPTVIVTAPEPTELSGWCDRVFTMTRGRLVELLGARMSRRAKVPAGV